MRSDGTFDERQEASTTNAKLDAQPCDEDRGQWVQGNSEQPDVLWHEQDGTGLHETSDVSTVQGAMDEEMGEDWIIFINNLHKVCGPMPEVNPCR